MTAAQRRRSCLHRCRFSRCVCWQYLASTHNRQTYARCLTVATFPATHSIHRAAVIGVPLLNGFLHVFIISYTKERGNTHSSPTYSLWALKRESPARNRMKLPLCFEVGDCFQHEVKSSRAPARLGAATYAAGRQTAFRQAPFPHRASP
ncbi:hypothetical protein LR69_00051 [Geobacillus sp. BCO2]|nr:hypothetical protein LR69_00051 [Geobacillus sp. BCO2]